MFSEFLKQVTTYMGNWGYLGVFISSMGIFPAEVVISIMGALKPSSLPLIALVASLGKALGSVLTYYLGKYLQSRDIFEFLNGKGKFLKISDSAYKRSQENVERNGLIYIFISRFVPWVRVVAALACGYLNYSVVKMVIAAFFGSFIYAYIFARVGAEVGFNWDWIMNFIDTFNYVVISAVVISIFIYIITKVLKRRK